LGAIFFLGIVWGENSMSTYTPIASQTLSSAAASVTFSGIPQTYTDLVLVAAATGDRSSNVDSLAIRFNSDSGSNYSYTYMTGESSTGAISGRASNQTNIWCGNFTSNNVNNPSSIIIQIQNYSNTTTNKTTLSRGNPIAGGGYSAVNANVGLWRNTAAVTSVTVRSETGNNFRSGSTFNLYGIASANAVTPKAIGGDTVMSDGTYWYHAFFTSGTFTPSTSITGDILVVAGGGGGSASAGGGGGAGGLLTFTSQSLTAQNYLITVGAGGTGGGINTQLGTNGTDSQFGSLTLVKGGGRGGNTSTLAGANGGSGGGGGGYSGNGAGGSPQSGQGFAGGNGDQDGGSGSNGGGAGGGAGGAGTNAAAVGVGGNVAGGIGATSSLLTAMGGATATGQLSGGNYYYAGGGGGNTYTGNTTPTSIGGLGGGGNGCDGGVSTAGFSNTGGGGGGGFLGGISTGGNGGSGIIIVRYTV
jgi:hypothetical protein